jgi:hypothetical protein
MEIRSTEVFEFKGPYGDRFGLLMSKLFQATMDRGKSQFNKQFSCVVKAQSKRQFEEFLNDAKVGEKIEISTISKGYATPRLEGFRRI